MISNIFIKGWEECLFVSDGTKKPIFVHWKDRAIWFPYEKNQPVYTFEGSRESSEVSASRKVEKASKNSHTSEPITNGKSIINNRVSEPEPTKSETEVVEPPKKRGGGGRKPRPKVKNVDACFHYDRIDRLQKRKQKQ